MNEWISVKDRLPSRDEEVLVYTDRYMYVAQILYFEKEVPQWITGSVVFEGVTHWTALPEGPK